MGKCTKEDFRTINALDMEFKFIPMAIFTWVIFIKTKNMEWEFSFGSVFVKFLALSNHKLSLNITREIGGVVFQMEKVSIIEQMVTIKLHNLGDIYIGDFKNGLKHGKGV